MEDSARSGRPSQTRHRLDRARRTGGEASAAFKVRVRAYQDSTRRIRRSAVDLNSTGLACFMLVDLDRPDARIAEPARTSRKCGSNRTHIRRDTECGGEHADSIPGTVTC